MRTVPARLVRRRGSRAGILTPRAESLAFELSVGLEWVLDVPESPLGPVVSGRPLTTSLVPADAGRSLTDFSKPAAARAGRG